MPVNLKTHESLKTHRPEWLCAFRKGKKASLSWSEVDAQLMALKSINKNNQSRRSEIINLGRIDCELSTPLRHSDMNLIFPISVIDKEALSTQSGQ